MTKISLMTNEELVENCGAYNNGNFDEELLKRMKYGEEYKKLYRQAISDHIKSAKLNYELQVKINKIWSLLHDKYSLADKSEIFQDIIKIIKQPFNRLGRREGIKWQPLLSDALIDLLIWIRRQK